MSNRMTLYDVLGVRSDASDGEIRAAFRRLTMRHHPDRVRGEDRRDAEERFQAITEAFNVLSRRETRDKYDREMSQGSGGSTIDAREIAKRLAGRGAQALKEGRVTAARTDLQMAVDHDDSNFKAHYFLGLTLARLPGEVREAMRHMERAMQLEPANATVKAGAATVALAAGMRVRAQRLAEEALSLDPTNAKANEVLASLGGEDQSQGGEGLLARLWRKG